MCLRLFTNLEDKKMQILALHRIGVTRDEVRNIVSNEIHFLFFVPFVVGAFHASFAFFALSNLLASNFWVMPLLCLEHIFYFSSFIIK